MLTPTGIDITATHTDEYSLTMPQTQFLAGVHEDQVSFELFVRSLPKNYGYLVAGGLADAVAYLENFHFTAEELDFLASQTVDPFDPASAPLYKPEFVAYLARLRFTGQVHALPEGTITGAQVPILRVTAPRIQATIVEAALLSIINQATGVATKAARIATVAQGKPTWDGSLRRLSGPAAGVPTARAAYLGGLTGTATVRAGMLLGIPTTGTMAHAWIQSFGEDGEQRAFETWLEHNPHRGVLLIDTYDVHRGIERAIAAALATDTPIKAVRIDSGDPVELSLHVRQRLDEAGMTHVKIMISGDLDEYKMQAMLQAGAPVDLFLVGTMLGNPGPLGAVYKITEQEVMDSTLQFVMKKAVGKQTDPGKHSVFTPAPGQQVIALADELVPGARQQMIRVMALGKPTHELPTLTEIRSYVAAQLTELPAELKRIDDPQPVQVTRTEKLWALRAQLGDAQAQQRTAGAAA